jgi:hypothetical protein
MYKLNMKTKEGIHTIVLCELCTRNLLIDTKEYVERKEKHNESL